MSHRFPHVVHENNDVRNGRVIGHRPEWNDLEKGILRTIVYDRLRDGNATDARSIFDQIISIYPDWQRSEHAIKSKLPDFLKECYDEQKRLATQTGSALSDLDRNFRARMDQAVSDAKEAGMREAAYLRAQIAELQADYDNQLAANVHLEVAHAIEVGRWEQRHETQADLMSAMAAISRDPAMVDQIGRSSLMGPIRQLLANSSLNGGLVGNVSSSSTSRFLEVSHTEEFKRSIEDAGERPPVGVTPPLLPPPLSMPQTTPPVPPPPLLPPLLRRGGELEKMKMGWGQRLPVLVRVREMKTPGATHLLPWKEPRGRSFSDVVLRDITAETR